MISLPNLLKLSEQKNRIKQYEFNDELPEEKPVVVKEEKSEKEKEAVKPTKKKQSDEALAEKRNKLKEEEKKAEQKAQEIIDNAKKQAEEILKKAKQEAQEMKEDALRKGKEEGYREGIEKGREEAYKEIRDTEGIKSMEYLNEIKSVINALSDEKEKILAQYKLNLVDIAITVAEKVIQVSLKTSGEIIERMILSATERLASKEWVKIYISKTDAELMIEGGLDIIHTLSNLSDNIKVIPMEKENQGTCIIEFPDEIIDASANTQVENIREIISNSAI